MEIHYAISEYPALLQNMVAKVYEAQSPFAEVDSITIPERNGAGVPTVGAGHQVPFTVNFTGRDKIPHIVRLFSASATLLHQYSVQPTESVVTIFDPIYFRVGDGGVNTPEANQPVYTNPAFAGLTAQRIEIWQEGFGFLFPDFDFELAGSSVTLLNTVQFESNQRWYMKRKPVIENAVNDSVVSKGYGGFIDIIADTDYTAEHLRKLIRLSGNGNYSFPALAAIPIGYIHTFSNFGINPSTPQINFLNGNLLFASVPKSFLIIPFGGTASFTWDGTNWNCIQSNIIDTSPVSGDILGQGSFYMGDILGIDIVYIVTHNLSIAYPYKIMGMLRGTEATKSVDNDCTWNTFSYTGNSFKINIQERNGGVQNLTFDYIIIKT